MKSSVRWSQTAVSCARICQPSSCSGNGAYPSPHTSSPIEWVHNEEIEYRGTFCLGRGWILWRYDFITVLWCYGTPNNVVDRLAQVILPTSYFGICFVVLLALALLGIKLWSRCVQQYWNAVQCNFSAPNFFFLGTPAVGQTLHSMPAHLWLHARCTFLSHTMGRWWINFSHRPSLEGN